MVICEIAPFAMKCEYENYELVSCACHRLEQALSDLLGEMPILKHFSTPYHCPDFMPKRSDTNV